MLPRPPRDCFLPRATRARFRAVCQTNRTTVISVNFASNTSTQASINSSEIPVTSGAQWLNRQTCSSAYCSSYIRLFLRATYCFHYSFVFHLALCLSKDLSSSLGGHFGHFFNDLRVSILRGCRGTLLQLNRITIFNASLVLRALLSPAHGVVRPH